MEKIAIPLILFILSLLLFTFQSDIIGLEFKGDENFYFQSSRQMVGSGNWITPYYFKKARFEKPILFYWLVASLFKLFGISWRMARLPSAISMAVVVALTYLFGDRFFNKRVAIFSSLVVMTTLATFRYARLVLPETFFLLLLCTSLYLMLKKAYLWAYLLMGLSILTKGPVGFILPLFIMAGYRYSMGERNFFKYIKFIQGLSLALLVSLPWFILMIKIHGQVYLDHIFFRETIQRIGGFDVGAPFYFIPIIFIFYLPWSLFIIQSIKDTALSIAKRMPYEDGTVFSFVWFFCVLIFFTFLGERHRHYMLALSVPFGLMVGNYFHNLFISKGRRKTYYILIPIILSFFIFELLNLSISKEIGGIGAIFLNKSYNIEEDDIVGIGSHAIVPQEVEIYVNHPVERFCYKLPPHMREEGDRLNTVTLNEILFKEGNSAFLLIKKSDFLKYILPETKKDLTILGKGYMFNKGVSVFKVFEAIRKFDKETLLGLFREEVYFVTNKEDAIKEGI